MSKGVSIGTVKCLRSGELINIENRPFTVRSVNLNVNQDDVRHEAELVRPGGETVRLQETTPGTEPFRLVRNTQAKYVSPPKI